MTLKLHHLRPAPGAKTAKTRVGRGEGSKGKTAGRGTKGSKARNNIPAYFEGGQLPLHMRLPKLKGFKNPFREEYQVVNLDRIGELFPDGGSITVDELVAKGAVRKGQRVKVLGQGEIDVAVQVSAQAFSASAKQKIEAAGGSIQCLIPARPVKKRFVPRAPATSPQAPAEGAPAGKKEKGEKPEKAEKKKDKGQAPDASAKQGGGAEGKKKDKTQGKPEKKGEKGGEG